MPTRSTAFPAGAKAPLAGRIAGATAGRVAGATDRGAGGISCETGFPSAISIRNKQAHVFQKIALAFMGIPCQRANIWRALRRLQPRFFDIAKEGFVKGRIGHSLKPKSLCFFLAKHGRSRFNYMPSLPHEVQIGLGELHSFRQSNQEEPMVRFTWGASRVVVGLGVCALSLCTLPSGALAAQNNLIQANLAGDLSSSTLGNMGGFYLYAYSIQNQVVGPPLIPTVGPNAVVTATGVSGGAAPNSLPYTTQGGFISVPTGKVGLPPPIFDGQKMFQGPPRMASISYGPSIRVGRLDKSTLSRPNDYASVLSTSGIYNGMGQAFVSSRGVRGIFATAYINGTPPPGGAAAGQAADPFQVPSGTAYSYTPTVTASAEIDSPNVSGGFQAYAVDSSVFTSDSVDNFIADGAPIGSTLWEVTVGRDMPTSGGITVDFELNPQALNEIQFPSAFLQSLGTFPDAITEAFLIDQAVDQSLQSQLTQAGSEFDLTGATLFPDGTTFQAIDGGVEYADDVNAGIAASPEPASVIILLAGGFVVLARRRRSV